MTDDKVNETTLKWLWRKKCFLLVLIIAFCLVIATISLSARLNRATADCAVATNNAVRFIKKPRNKISHELTYYRLPRHVVPLKYNLLLRPNMDDKIFSGKVSIVIQVMEPTRNITLHTNKLDISSVVLKYKQQNLNIQSVVKTTDDREFLVVQLQNEIAARTYELTILYSGRLDRGYISFYQSKLKSGR